MRKTGEARVEPTTPVLTGKWLNQYNMATSLISCYFLQNSNANFQVGPEQKQYKVRDRKELEFKPEQIVSDIAHIYCYLGVSDSFLRAVIGESRSFSLELFQQAMSVLKKIGKSEDFLARFQELADKVKVRGLVLWFKIPVNSFSVMKGQSYQFLCINLYYRKKCALLKDNSMASGD